MARTAPAWSRSATPACRSCHTPASAPR
ncbi:MAG: hypothetical protein IT198_00905 [Acidimicrobiia bacterium]|nr:hypothetical protein [Acidimicrobiia bacterium]